MKLTYEEALELKEMFVSRIARSRDDQEAGRILAMFKKVMPMCGVTSDLLLRRGS